MVRLRCKVAVVGDSTVGKTSILKMFVEHTFPNQYLMTIHAQVYNRVVAVNHPSPPSDVPTLSREVHSDDEYSNDDIALMNSSIQFSNTLNNNNNNVNNNNNSSVDQYKNNHHQQQHHSDEVELYLFDISGSKLYETEVQELLQDLNAFIIVYDISNEQSFKNAQQWYDKCAKTRQLSTDKKKHSPTLIGLLIGNKSDLHQFQKVSIVQGEAFAKNNNLQFFPLSASNDNGTIEEPFQYIADKFLNMYNERIETVSYLLEHER